VAIKVDASEDDSPGGILKNQKFKRQTIPLMVYYSSADVKNSAGWYDLSRSTGALPTENFLARLRALK